MAGLAWEQHVAFLDDPELAKEIVAKVRRQVRECAAHPALLCYAIGNEIPAPIVRWHGKSRIEAFLERLYWAAKAADPEGLFTYVNYPSTEYLELPFLDLTSFNVFLEDEADLRVLPGPPPEPLRRPPAADHRDRHGQPPQRRGGPGAGPALAGEARLRHRRRRGLRLLLDRRVASRRARRARTGTSAWSTGSGSPSPRCPRSGRPSPPPPSRRRGRGRRSRWSSAPTTASGPCRSASGGSPLSPTRTSRSSSSTTAPATARRTSPARTASPSSRPSTGA